MELQEGEYDKAIADLNEAIRLDPEDAHAYSNRGKARLSANEYDKAIADCNEAIRLDPIEPSSYATRGIAWGAKNDFDKAVADLGEAIRLDPKYALAYGSRGWAWDQKRAFDKAIADYNEAVRLDPKYAYAHKGRAWLLATCPDAKYRDGKKAVQSATTACELSEWKDPGELDTLAAAHAEAGAFEPAVKWESRAIKLVSDDEIKEKYSERLDLCLHKKPYRATER